MLDMRDQPGNGVGARHAPNARPSRMDVRGPRGTWPGAHVEPGNRQAVPCESARTAAAEQRRCWVGGGKVMRRRNLVNLLVAVPVRVTGCGGQAWAAIGEPRPGSSAGFRPRCPHPVLRHRRNAHRGRSASRLRPGDPPLHQARRGHRAFPPRAPCRACARRGAGPDARWGLLDARRRGGGEPRHLSGRTHVVSPAGVSRGARSSPQRTGHRGGGRSQSSGMQAFTRFVPPARSARPVLCG